VVRGLPIEPSRRQQRRVRVSADKGPVVETTAEELYEDEEDWQHDRRRARR
jgi:hypothetical protein